MVQRIGLVLLVACLGACGPAAGPTAAASTTLKIYVLVTEADEQPPPLVSPPLGWSSVPILDAGRLRVVQTVAVANPVGRTVSLWVPGRGAWS